MNFDDEQFEKHLRKFRPRRVTPLPAATPKTLPWTARLAVVALTIAFVMLLLHIPRAPRKIEFIQFKESVALPTAVSVRELNAAERDGLLDQALSTNAENSLPRTDQPNTALNTLAKD